MELQCVASSPGEPTKFGTGRGDRFHTKTGDPVRRRCAATARPMIPRPITPMFLFAGCDVDARRSIKGNSRSDCREISKEAMQKFRHSIWSQSHFKADSER